MITTLALVTAFASANTRLASVAVEVRGAGYLRFAREGRITYSRQAIFSVKKGQLVADGMTVLPHIEIPGNAESFYVDGEGVVWYKKGSEKAVAGRIALAVFSSEGKVAQTGAYCVSSEIPKLFWPGEQAGSLLSLPLDRPTDNEPTIPQEAAKPADELKVRTPEKLVHQADEPAPKPQLVFAGLIPSIGGFAKLGDLRPTHINYKSRGDFGISTLEPKPFYAAPAVAFHPTTSVYSESANAAPTKSDKPDFSRLEPEKVKPVVPVTQINHPKEPRKPEPVVEPTKSGPLPAFVGKISIAIDGDLIVEGDKIYLGEIATLAGDETVCNAISELAIGDSPAAGVYRGLDSGSIVAALRRAGFDTKKFTISVDKKTRVTRKAQEISSKELIQAAVMAAVTELQINGALVCDQTVPPLAVPIGDFTIQTDTVRRSGTNITVTLKIVRGEKMLGMRAINLRPGKDSLAVSQGADVKLLVKTGGAAVEVTAKARAGGFLGETIEVVTPQGKVFKAKIIGTNLLEVNV